LTGKATVAPGVRETWDIIVTSRAATITTKTTSRDGTEQETREIHSIEVVGATDDPDIFDALYEGANPPGRAWLDGHEEEVRAVIDAASQPVSAVQVYRDAFSAHRARLAAAGRARLRGIYDAVIARYGETARGAYNDPTYGRVWGETLSYCIDRLGDRMNSPVALNEAKLDKLVAEWAAEELEGAAVKLAEKVGDLRDVKVSQVDGISEWFVVTGTHPNGYLVRVSQSQIINVSSKGKLFNQWPALIYVDGKKMSEAAYKRLGAD
jgi:hypothetical protein